MKPRSTKDQRLCIYSLLVQCPSSRGSLVFTAFGNVRSEADRMRSALLLDLGAATDLPARDSGLAREVELFLRVLEDAYVQAGPYLSCTHGFLFSFYGILATYIAILYQSF